MSTYDDSTGMSTYVDTTDLSTYVDTMAESPTLYNARSLLRLGSAITALRRDRSLTQAQLAERAGVSRAWLSSAENGRTEGLDVGRVMRVLDALDASLTIRDDTP